MGAILPKPPSGKVLGVAFAHPIHVKPFRLFGAWVKRKSENCNLAPIECNNRRHSCSGMFNRFSWLCLFTHPAGRLAGATSTPTPARTSLGRTDPISSFRGTFSRLARSKVKLPACLLFAPTKRRQRGPTPRQRSAVQQISSMSEPTHPSILFVDDDEVTRQAERSGATSRLPAHRCWATRGPAQRPDSLTASANSSRETGSWKTRCH
jgi:hypothetical protein